MFENTTLDDVFQLLGAIGALNWGLVGFARFNLVRALFGRDTFMTRLVYGLVGLAGLWGAYQLFTRVTRPGYQRVIRRGFSDVA